jgi:hypothetical protein
MTEDRKILMPILNIFECQSCKREFGFLGEPHS